MTEEINYSKRSFFLQFYKEPGISSAFALNKLKKSLKIKKAGYCGTLDPIAEGLLVVAFNKATKLIRFVTEDRKIYSGEFIAGKRSVSFDIESELITVSEDFDLKAIDWNSVAEKFSGKILQKPPAYSAIKIDGKRAYERARNGESLEMPEREVRIFTLELKPLENGKVAFYVECSKGTYIRSLVNDIGEYTNIGGVLSKLVRERVGDFSAKRAATLSEIEKRGEKFSGSIMGIKEFLVELPQIEVNETVYGNLRNGLEIQSTGVELFEGKNLVLYGGKPAYLLEKRGVESSYVAFLMDEE